MISNADQLLDEKKSRMDLDGLIIDAVIKSVAPRLVPQAPDGRPASVPPRSKETQKRPRIPQQRKDPAPTGHLEGSNSQISGHVSHVSCHVLTIKFRVPNSFDPNVSVLQQNLHLASEQRSLAEVLPEAPAFAPGPKTESECSTRFFPCARVQDHAPYTTNRWEKDICSKKKQ